MQRTTILILLGALATACAHSKPTPRGAAPQLSKDTLRVGVVVIDEGFVDEAAATAELKQRASEQRAKRRQEHEQFAKEMAGKQQRVPEMEPDEPYIWENLCKKRFLSRYTRVPQAEARRGTDFTWLLINSCRQLPRMCGGAPLEIVFNQWQYTPELVDPGSHPIRFPYSAPQRIGSLDPDDTGARTPFESTCRLRAPVEAQKIAAITCPFARDVAEGSYKFQVVLRCGGRKIDNWDPEIVVNSDAPGGPGGGNE